MKKPGMKELVRFAQLKGVKAYKVRQSKFIELERDERLQEAPFTSFIGINWTTKELFYTRENQWVEGIHELGHLIASSKKPRDSKEWDFFGWEIALVHHLGLPLELWIAGNQDYGVDDGHELGGLTSIQLHRMLAERLEAAVAGGLVHAGGMPLAIR
jgi:hypothetical protein